MSIDVQVPAVGESVTSGVLARWIVGDGEQVEDGQSIFELESDKANTDVPAPAAGVLHHKASEGDEVEVGAVVATIEEGATAAPKKKAEPEPTDQKETAAASGGGEHSGAGNAEITPLAKKIADDQGIDVSTLKGSGPGGKITKGDVLAAGGGDSASAEKKTSAPAEKAAAKPATPKPAAPKVEPKPKAAKRPAGDRSTERVKMSMLRRRIGERLIAAQRQTASLTTFNDADLSAVIALRKKYKEPFKEEHGTGLGFMSFFVKAAVQALRENRDVNAQIDGQEIVYQNFYDIGIAVSTPKGLMVPVLRDADQMTFAEIEGQIIDFAKRARDGKIGLDELQGGTFTITNGGVFGSMLSTPILNPPQSAILGMHRIEQRPVAVDGQVEIRPMMYLALTYDHRIIDGKQSVTFLKRIKECIEDPERLMLEI